MMRKLDQRGMAAWEFCLVAFAFFPTLFTIIDLGRYTITLQSLRALADAGAIEHRNLVLAQQITDAL